MWKLYGPWLSHGCFPVGFAVRFEALVPAFDLGQTQPLHLGLAEAETAGQHLDAGLKRGAKQLAIAGIG